MFDAVPISSVSILFTKFTCPFGGMTREIIDVPFPRASVKPLINYLMITNARAKGKYTGTKRKRELVFERHDTRGVKERALKRKGLIKREKKKTPSHLFLLLLGAFSLVSSAGANENSLITNE